ncbi:hypothetical protein RBWH47_03394 [Rhodopirellula baltica WH47]|uniref:Uncharacterized protein n=1 Tax=Rhodopirellula baltica WH47 TaxID=991778 RepID=F2AXH0_RHOBT|nr:hypothetical protein RBWH47_03394 [Rhodopirellula baltica WH47]
MLCEPITFDCHSHLDYPGQEEWSLSAILAHRNKPPFSLQVINGRRILHLFAILFESGGTVRRGNG